MKINSMMQLDEVQETLLKEIVLNINIEDITPELMEALENKVAESEGNTQLKIRINDPRNNISVPFLAKKKKIRVTKEFCDFCDAWDIRFMFMS